MQVYREGMGLTWTPGPVWGKILPEVTPYWTIGMAMSIPTKNGLRYFLVINSKYPGIFFRWFHSSYPFLVHQQVLLALLSEYIASPLTVLSLHRHRPRLSCHHFALDDCSSLLAAHPFVLLASLPLILYTAAWVIFVKHMSDPITLLQCSPFH